MTFNVQEHKENIMRKPVALSPSRLVAVAAFSMIAPFATASGQPDVSWSITVGSPQPAPRVVYGPPPMVYVQPQPVYIRPQPVYVRPAPVAQYYGPPYYIEEVRYKKLKHRHWKRHHHGHNDD